jgi:DNA polymerase-3 subunit gamma/tau
LEKKQTLSLARKWRPQTFGELVGQEIITETLKKSIAKEQTAQALVFCGGRGTGKTSCARILSKALNCSNSKEAEPCNECENCQEINNGSAIDIVEIDAASNRGIDSIRKIRDNLVYLPIKCRFKVYIIDEVHMLTMESFNALLKSIEEPPAYVKFVLATTHAHKIPETILSRCQRYNFHNITFSKMKTQLQKVAKAELLEINDLSIEKIIQISGGALRDALVNLDMIRSFCGEKITEQEVSKILEITSKVDLEELFLAIARADAAASIKKFHHILDKGVSIPVLLNDFLFFIHKLSFQKIREHFAGFSADLQNVLQNTSLAKLQQYFQILLEIEQNTKISKMTNLCLEMGILKLCSAADFASIQDILSELEKRKNLERTSANTQNQPNSSKEPKTQQPSYDSFSEEKNAGSALQEESSKTEQPSYASFSEEKNAGVGSASQEENAKTEQPSYASFSEKNNEGNVGGALQEENAKTEQPSYDSFSEKNNAGVGGDLQEENAKTEQPSYDSFSEGKNADTAGDALQEENAKTEQPNYDSFVPQKNAESNDSGQENIDERVKIAQNVFKNSQLIEK